MSEREGWPEGTTTVKVKIRPENMESLRLIALRYGINRSTALNNAIAQYRFFEDILVAGGKILQERADKKVFELDFKNPSPNLGPEDRPTASE